MQKINRKKKHSKDAIILSISKGFERAAYYGVRAAIVLYLIGETINLSRGEALSIYGSYTMGVMIFGVVGAVLGDLLFGNKRAILIGGVLSILGCVLLCIESLGWIKSGLGLLALGTGFYSSNLIARFGKEYLDKKELLDAGFSIYYSATNIGAAVGVVLIGYLSNIQFKYGMLLALVFILISMLLVYFVKKQSSNFVLNIYQKQARLSKYKYVVAVILFVGCFWAIYESSYFAVIGIQRKIGETLGTYIPESLLVGNSLQSLISMIILIGLAFLWSRYYGNQFLKLLLGFLVFAIALFMLSTISVDLGEGGVGVFILSVVLIGLGESLITPLISSITVKYANPKYLALVLALVNIPSLGFNKIIAGILGENSEKYTSNTMLLYSACILVFLSLIGYLFFRKIKKEEGALLTKEAKEFIDS